MSTKCHLCDNYVKYICSGCIKTQYCSHACQKSDWSVHQTHCPAFISGMSKHEKIARRDRVWNDMDFQFSFKKKSALTQKLTSKEKKMLNPNNLVVDVEYYEANVEWPNPKVEYEWKYKSINRMRIILEDAFNEHAHGPLHVHLKEHMPLFIPINIETAVPLVFQITVPIATGQVIFTKIITEMDWKLLAEYIEKAHFWKVTATSKYRSNGAVRVKIQVTSLNINHKLGVVKFGVGQAAVLQSDLEAELGEKINQMIKDRMLKPKRILQIAQNAKQDGILWTKEVKKIAERAKQIIERHAKVDDEEEDVAKWKSVASKFTAILKTDPKDTSPDLGDSVRKDLIFLEQWRLYLEEWGKVGYLSAQHRVLRAWKDNEAYYRINGILYGNLNIYSEEFQEYNNNDNDEEYSFEWSKRNGIQLQDFILSKEDDMLWGSIPKSTQPFDVLRAFWSKDESLDGEQRGPDFKTLKPGDIITNKGFTPTSYAVPPGNFFGTTCCIMKISVPAGFPCVLIESKSGTYFSAEKEHEILFPAGTKFKFNYFTTYNVDGLIMDVAEMTIVPDIPEELY